jgi:hypothetical protein
LTGALKSYGDSLAIRERLASSDPGNAGWQRDLSVSYGKLGKALKLVGDKTKAHDAVRQARSIMERLTKMSPFNAIWKRDLIRFDELIVLGPTDP